MNTDEQVETMRQVLGDALAKQMGIGYYYVTAETARAALAVVPVPEWQPIETAPRDGRLLLCASMTNQLHGYYDRAVLRYISELQGWSCPGLSGLSPTHWQPLPAPPERAGT